MPRFYCPPPLPTGGTFDLPPDAAHHASRVLRLREGNRVKSSTASAMNAMV